MADVMLLDYHPPRARAAETLSWSDPDHPLPVRVIRRMGRGRWPALDAPTWFQTGQTGVPFNFCRHIHALSADMAARCEELRHVDVDRILFAVTQARSSRPHGLQARVTPLRFRGGSLTRRRRGVCYQVQRFFVNQREVLYQITFCLPRFLDLDFDEKFVTLFHELYHISPEFNGDLRRHDGRYALHSHSQRLYDQHMAALARGYLAEGADPALNAFLRLDFDQLERRHGSVIGAVVPRAKQVPVFNA